MEYNVENAYVRINTMRTRFIHKWLQCGHYPHMNV